MGVWPTAPKKRMGVEGRKDCTQVHGALVPGVWLPRPANTARSLGLPNSDQHLPLLPTHSQWPLKACSHRSPTITEVSMVSVPADPDFLQPQPSPHIPVWANTLVTGGTDLLGLCGEHGGRTVMVSKQVKLSRTPSPKSCKISPV